LSATQPILVKNEKIDLEKWDDCLRQAHNSRPYGFAAMLNAACGKQWHALILGDYEAVMPLPYNHKLLITKQVYQPILLQQLGVFSKKRLSPYDLRDFLIAAKQHFKYINTQLNSDILDENLELKRKIESIFIENTSITARDNHILHLQKPYEILHNNYNNGLRSRLRQTQKNGLELVENVNFQDWLAIFTKYQLPKITDLPPRIFNKIGEIVQKIPEMSEFLGVKDSVGVLIGVAFVVYSPQRITVLLNASTDDGRRLAATHFLIDQIIQKHANTNTILDFEGSSIPSIAEFNRSFGAENQPYFVFKYRYW
jgi:hypothetical protein